MRPERIMMLAVLAFNLIFSMSDSALTPCSNASQDSGAATADEIVNAAIKSVNEDDWPTAESKFREAMRLEPKQALWHIQLTIALSQQKKWKEAFKEVDKLSELGAIDWLLTMNKKMPDGKVAFVNTEIFGDEQQGISRYLKAVKEKKNVASISEDIGNKLEAFAKQNKIALTYDISKFKNMRFASGKTPDVTADFIAYYNALY
jgi:hypothetical protein